MIPRDILKKIRQIEIRTNLVVTGSGERTRPGCSQRRPRRWPLRGARVPTNSVVLPRNVRREGAPNRSRGGCAPHGSQQHPVHFRRSAKRLSNSAKTCSAGMPPFGFFRSSSARRSSSAFCSGVSSSSESPNSKSMVSTSSRLSASGIRRSSSRISVLLMAAIYSFALSAQARFFRRFAKRFSISAKTCSAGIPRPGFFNASSARRSSSSICSGEGSGSYPFSWMLPQTRCASSMRSARLNFASISSFKVFQAKTPLGMGGAFQSWKPSMNSSQRRCASSTRSSNGSLFAAEKNFAKDMNSIYCVGTRAQAEFFARPIRNPQSALSAMALATAEIRNFP